MANTYTIFSQFKSISSGVTGSKESYNVIPLPGMLHKLGVSNEGFPVFFVATVKSESLLQNIIMEMLCVEYNLPCTIVEDGVEKHTDNFSIISLRTSQEYLQSYFIDIFHLMLQRLSLRPSKKELSFEVENLITIFSALNKPPMLKAQGLWAELLVIEQSKIPQNLISAWHNVPSAKYDFTMGKDKLEIKSTSSENRIHNFSLDQLNETLNSNLIIGSVIVRESGKCNEGLSIQDLCDRISQKVKEVDLRIALYSKVADTMGADFSETHDVHFDYVGAVDTLAYFNAQDIPKISKDDVPVYVSNVKFTSDLSSLADIRNGELVEEVKVSKLYSSLF